MLKIYFLSAREMQRLSGIHVTITYLCYTKAIYILEYSFPANIQMTRFFQTYYRDGIKNSIKSSGLVGYSSQCYVFKYERESKREKKFGRKGWRDANRPA